MSAREAAGIGIDVCRAVSALHAHGFVHRDIKAANVMREVGGRIVLMDFSGRTHRRCAPADAAGTPLYWRRSCWPANAPRGERRLRIGVLLFFLLTSRHPSRARRWRTWKRRTGRPPGPSARCAARSPEALVRVVERAIAAPGDARFHTVGELEHALGAIFAPVRPAVHGWRCRPRRPSLPAATLGLGAAMIALLLAAAALAWRGLPTAGQEAAVTPIEFDLVVEEPRRLDPTSNDARVSPDGRIVVFSAWANGTQLLYRGRSARATSTPRRHRGRGAAVLVGRQPLRRLPRQRARQARGHRRRAGPNICPSSQFGGAAWNRDDVIVFSQVTSLWTVAAGGGTPQRFRIPSELGPDAVAVGPAFRPDQQTFTYRIGFGAKDTAGTYLARLDPQSSTRLFDLGPNTVLGQSTVAWISNGALHAQALDPRSLLPTGPVSTLEGGVLGNDGQA